jgi:hypothetical protein
MSRGGCRDGDRRWFTWAKTVPNFRVSRQGFTPRMSSWCLMGKASPDIVPISRTPIPGGFGRFRASSGGFVAPGEGVIATFRGPHASQRHPGGLKRAHWPRGTARVGRRRRFWRRHAVRLKMTSRRASQGFSAHLSTESRNLQCPCFWRTPAQSASKSAALARRRHRLRGRCPRQ